MIEYPKGQCAAGHDLKVTGVYVYRGKNPRCAECARENMRRVRSTRPRYQANIDYSPGQCAVGHDYALTGRYAGGQCVLCKRADALDRYREKQTCGAASGRSHGDADTLGAAAPHFSMGAIVNG